MAEILHFEILRKHGQTNKQTNTHTDRQTDRQTWALQYLALPLRGRGKKIFVSHGVPIRNMYAKFHNDRLRNG